MASSCGVVPARVADAQIDPHIAVTREAVLEGTLAGAGIEHARRSGRRARTHRRRRRWRPRNGGYSGAGGAAAAADGAVAQLFFRASTMIVDPARHAASITVNGRAGQHNRQDREGSSQPRRRRLSGPGGCGAPSDRAWEPAWSPARRDCRAARNTCSEPAQNRNPAAAHRCPLA